jgi:pyroglutamyl-peptidase
VKILATGFDPFGGEKINPAYEAVKLLPREIAGAEIFTAEIPTVFGKCGDVLRRLIRERRPDAVLCVGQAGGRSVISVEKVAVNLMEARIPDNEKMQPSDEPVVPGGPAAYFSGLPVKAMVRAVREQGIPAGISYTAGTFVCNDVMYRLLHMAATEFADPAGRLRPRALRHGPGRRTAGGNSQHADCDHSPRAGVRRPGHRGKPGGHQRSCRGDPLRFGGS